MVLRLRKSLYGLKQAPRIWYLLLSEVILGLGFRVLEMDNSINTHEQVIIAVFIDDMLIAGPTKDVCNSISQEISQHFDITNKGAVVSFLGLSITRNWDKHAIAISQPAYIDKLIAKYRLNEAKTYDTPLPQGYQFTSADYEFNPTSSSPRKS